jgi:hypothetical protein
MSHPTTYYVKQLSYSARCMAVAALAATLCLGLVILMGPMALLPMWAGYWANGVVKRADAASPLGGLGSRGKSKSGALR